MQGSSRPPGKDELRVGYTVMVGSIPDRAEVRDLEDALRPFGAIDEIRFLPIKKNRARCAFVQFTSPASAEHVLKERKLVVCGFKVRTSKYFLRGEPQRVNNVFIGKLSRETTERDLWNEFSKYGKIELIEHMEHRHCAYVHYESPESVLRVLGRRGSLTLCGQVVVIEIPKGLWDSAYRDGRFDQYIPRRSRSRSRSPPPPMRSHSTSSSGAPPPSSSAATGPSQPRPSSPSRDGGRSRPPPAGSPSLRHSGRQYDERDLEERRRARSMRHSPPPSSHRRPPSPPHHSHHHHPPHHHPHHRPDDFPPPHHNNPRGPSPPHSYHPHHHQRPPSPPYARRPPSPQHPPRPSFQRDPPLRSFFPPATIRISRLSPLLKEQEIHSQLSKFGPIQWLFLQSIHNESFSTGRCWVEFVNVDSARDAHDNAPQSIAQSFPNAIVEMTTPTLIAGIPVEAKVTVRNIPEWASEDALRQVLSRCGKITQISIESSRAQHYAHSSQGSDTSSGLETTGVVVFDSMRAMVNALALSGQVALATPETDSQQQQQRMLTVEVPRDALLPHSVVLPQQPLPPREPHHPPQPQPQQHYQQHYQHQQQQFYEGSPPREQHAATNTPSTASTPTTMPATTTTSSSSTAATAAAAAAVPVRIYLYLRDRINPETVVRTEALVLDASTPAPACLASVCSVLRLPPRTPLTLRNEAGDVVSLPHGLILDGRYNVLLTE